MTASLVPLLIDALVSACQVAVLCPVHDGYPLSNDPGTFLAVGVDDPADQSRADSADSQIEYAYAAGRRASETATVRCAVQATDGDGDLGVARRDAYAVLDAVDGILRATHPPLGLPTVTSLRISSTRLYQDQTAEDGAWVLLAFQVSAACTL